MLRVFLDANILVSVLNKEYPIFSYSSRILSLASHSDFEIFTSPICLAISFYFAEKKHGTRLAKQKIELLCQHIKIAGNSDDAVFRVLEDKRIHDFEDGLEYYAAEQHECRCIVTEDVEDFYFSEIEVLNCQSFFRKYMAN